MKINYISQNNTHFAPKIQRNDSVNNKISFRSLGYSPDYYTDKYGFQRSIQHTTGIRNKELDHDRLAKLIKKRFKNFDKVNIMPMCVSDGTEAYCIANFLIKQEGYEKFQKKYTPIIATDISSEIINNYGKQGLILLDDNERYIFDNVDKTILKEVNKDDYKIFITSQFSQPEHLYKIASKYSENFEFKVQDFNKRIDEIEDKGNSVIILRNTLYQSYGDGYESQILISDLANKMKGASLLVVGGYDMAHMPNLKKTLGDYFVELQPNVWGLKDYKNITSIFKRMFNKLVNNK